MEGVKSNLSKDPFYDLHQKCLDEIMKRWVPGAFDFLEENHGNLLKEIDNVERKIDVLWQKGLEGEVSLEEFREELKRFYKLYERCINLYKKEKGL